MRDGGAGKLGIKLNAPREAGSSLKKPARAPTQHPVFRHQRRVAACSAVEHRSRPRVLRDQEVSAGTPAVESGHRRRGRDDQVPRWLLLGRGSMDGEIHSGANDFRVH